MTDEAKPAAPVKIKTFDYDTRVIDATLGMKYRDGSRVGIIVATGPEHSSRHDRTHQIIGVKFAKGKDAKIEQFRHERVGYFTQVVDVPTDAMD